MRIHVVGDSISVQYGPYLEADLVGLVEYSRKTGEEEALRDLDIPQGANGGDSRRVLEYLRALHATDALEADLLVVNCGLHDIKTDPQTGRRQVELEHYKENLHAIVAAAATLGCALVWIRTTPCDEAVHNKPASTFHRFARDCEAYNAAADGIMRESGVPILDLFTFTLNLGPDLYCDHVHFHEPIREKQAAFIAGWLVAYKGWKPA